MAMNKWTPNLTCSRVSSRSQIAPLLCSVLIWWFDMSSAVGNKTTKDFFYIFLKNCWTKDWRGCDVIQFTVEHCRVLCKHHNLILIYLENGKMCLKYEWNNHKCKHTSSSISSVFKHWAEEGKFILIWITESLNGLILKGKLKSNFYQNVNFTIRLFAIYLKSFGNVQKGLNLSTMNW